MLSLKQRAKHVNEKKCKYCQFIVKFNSNFKCTNDKSLYFGAYINANNTCPKFCKRAK